MTHSEDWAAGTVTCDDSASYWDGYYASHATVARALPSQFAVFVLGELDGPHRVVDLGCGNGRDSFLFACFGHDVVGVDRSAAAIASCRRLGEALGESAEFVLGEIDDPTLADRIRGTGPRLVYARFLLHAITESEEERLLDLAAAVTDPGDLLAVEYRTVRDASGVKATPEHFRRYVVPAEFEAGALARGFEPTYAVEGFGHAKFQADDAYVARALFRRPL